MENIDSKSKTIASNRNWVLCSYEAAKALNQVKFERQDPKATSEYIYPNQIEDAFKIVNEFYQNNKRVISITKKTKVGLDGLMIEIAKQMATHIDDNFIISPQNIFIITGMSNKAWENDMKEKAPEAFRHNIAHHGKLKKINIKDAKDALIIIDEIDTGDSQGLILHKVLESAGLLNIDYMSNNNIRFVIASATMVRELYDLYKWGNLHSHFKMTIPENYIGHKDFLDKNIIQEFYPIKDQESAEKWIQEDIIDNYQNNYRVHIIRVSKKNVIHIQKACRKKDIIPMNHTSNDRISDSKLKILFEEELKKHYVLIVKGFFRRANLIPTKWKLRIGTIHEQFTSSVDNNVQIQGLVGRMTGYWKNLIEDGHETGPYRTSIKAIKQYDKHYENPFDNSSYSSAGFSKNKNGRVTSQENTFLSPENIINLTAMELPNSTPIDSYRIYSDLETIKQVCHKDYLNYHVNEPDINQEGFYITSLNKKQCVVQLRDAIDAVPNCYGTNKGQITWRTYLPCYIDITNKDTLRFVLIIRPKDKFKLPLIDANFQSV